MKKLIAVAAVAAMPLAAFAQSAPDLIIHHARVYTADPAHRWAEAVAIRGNRIAAVGTNAEITALAGNATRRIDAAGKLVVPGFNDAHTHQGPRPGGISIASANDAKWELVSAAVAGAADEAPEDVWIYGTIGPQILADPAVTAQALDKASGRRKVVLESFTGHGLIFSTAAMKALGIRSDAADPAGGWFDRDASKQLTGKAFEYAGWNALRSLAEKTAADDAADQLRSYADGALGYGVTSIQNMSLLGAGKYETLLRHHPAPLRVRIIRFPMTTAAGRDAREGSDLPATHRERPLSVINGVKWILDGTPGEQGAAVRTKYPNSEASGRLDFPPEEIRAILKEAYDSREPLLLHVAGDRTAATVLEAMRAIGPAEEWRKRRVRFEHGDGLLPDLIPAAKDLGIVVVVNPTHLVAKPLYPAGAFLPMKSLVKAGIPIAIGSDGTPNPGRDISLALGAGAEALTREEAVDAYTRGGAYAEFAENDKGTIAAGKLADLAMLSQDIFTVAPAELPATRSVLTIVDGKIVWAAEGNATPQSRSSQP